MTLEAIRRRYNVPAKQGRMLLFQGERHIITGSERGTLRLRIRSASGGKPFPVHPTWEMDYGTAPVTEETERG